MKRCIMCGVIIEPSGTRVSTNLGDVCVRDAPDTERVDVSGVEFRVVLWTPEMLERIRVESARWVAVKGASHADHGGFSPQSAYWHCYDCGVYDHPY